MSRSIVKRIGARLVLIGLLLAGFVALPATPVGNSALATVDCAQCDADYQACLDSCVDQPSACITFCDFQYNRCLRNCE